MNRTKTDFTSVCLFGLATISTACFAVFTLGTLAVDAPLCGNTAWFMFFLAAASTLSNFVWSVILIGARYGAGWAMFTADCVYVLMIGLCATPLFGHVFLKI